LSVIPRRHRGDALLSEVGSIYGCESPNQSSIALSDDKAWDAAERQLFQWLLHPEVREAMDIEECSETSLRAAIRWIVEFKRFGMQGPLSVAVEPSGEVVFDFVSGAERVRIRILTDGSADKMTFCDSRLVSRRYLPLPEAKEPDLTVQA
jgi:hypothetical protein